MGLTGEDVALVKGLIEKMSAHIEGEESLNRKMSIVVWGAVGSLIFCIVCLVLVITVYYSLKEDNAELAQTNAELVTQNHKKNLEIAMRDARFQASKGLVGESGVRDDLIKIQYLIDQYASRSLRNGSTREMTSDDVRREVCEVLSREGYNCAP